LTEYKKYKDLEGSYEVIKVKLISFIAWIDKAFYNWNPEQKAKFCDRMQDVFTKTIRENDIQ
jgi:hypothetical protein